MTILEPNLYDRRRDFPFIQATVGPDPSVIADKS